MPSVQSKDFPIYDELDSDDEDDNILHGSELDASELDDEMDHDVDEHDDSRYVVILIPNWTYA